MKLKYTVLVSLVALPFFASATGTGTATINVSADVNPDVAILSANNTALTDLQLSFIPGIGLNTASEMVRLASNDPTHGVDVSLANAMQLTNSADASTVPMTVTLAGKTLSTTTTSYDKALFTNGETSPMQLSVKATGDTKSLTAGHYTGVINLVLAQSTN
ncbi:putative fimbrial subunit [Escherichia coli M605]|uniref:Putative fimbrial subunit n=1 Tax=Escherichia coli M605 TaxID=656417 RepID=F4SYH1_ECOLX|nr:CS1 type fimbrial major subunit [Escherichia coli]EGI16418.1 putative fimbrial subunit [Escherichia coli M605]